MIHRNNTPAILALADGQVFEGKSIGVPGITQGEIIFNTAMSGYQEVLTDPSYAQQLITFTYPHIGNVGVNPEDIESDTIWAQGLVVRDVSLIASNWRHQQSLPEYLQAHKVVGISGIDTRALTNILREKGTQTACIMAGQIDVAQAQAQAAQTQSLKGCDLAQVVSTEQPYEWQKGSVQLIGAPSPPPTAEFHVVVYDFGVKHNILRLLVDRGCKVTLVPATTSAQAVLAYQPDGVFLSNGPGDPEPCTYAIDAIQTLLAQKMPLFGICLGHQLLALAAGAQTFKMKFGHHGANHPVQCLETGQVWITSQNHGFAVDEDHLPAGLTVTHRSLFDQTIQGVSVDGQTAFGFQGHPEASPGPRDGAGLFDAFVNAMGRLKRGQT